MYRKIAILCVCGLLVTSCLTNRAQTGGAGGAAAGAVIGQAIGQNTEATLLGAAIGGLLGYMVGNEMDKSDRQAVNSVYESNKDYQASSWVNPNSGNQYTVTPQSTYKDDYTGRDCRDAEILATIDGKAEKTTARACRENGVWVIHQ